MRITDARVLVSSKVENQREVISFVVQGKHTWTIRQGILASGAPRKSLFHIPRSLRFFVKNLNTEVLWIGDSGHGDISRGLPNSGA